MEITVRYRYAASIGSLLWALTKGASDWEEAFDWGQVMWDSWPYTRHNSLRVLSAEIWRCNDVIDDATYPP